MNVLTINQAIYEALSDTINRETTEAKEELDEIEEAFLEWKLSTNY